MKCSELIKKLEEHIKLMGDSEVCFDTEAAKFDQHIIPIEGAYTLNPDHIKDIGLDSNIFILDTGNEYYNHKGT